MGVVSRRRVNSHCGQLPAAQPCRRPAAPRSIFAQRDHRPQVCVCVYVCVWCVYVRVWCVYVRVCVPLANNCIDSSNQLQYQHCSNINIVKMLSRMCAAGINGVRCIASTPSLSMLPAITATSSPSRRFVHDAPVSLTNIADNPGAVRNVCITIISPSPSPSPSSSPS